MLVSGIKFPMAQKWRSWILVAAWSGALLAILPVVCRWQPPPPRPLATHLALDVAYALAALLCYSFYRKELPQLGRPRAAALVFLVFLLSSVANQIHSFNVDHATNYAPPIANETWQEQLQQRVIQLSPGATPHSYRFLPNGLVLWMQSGGVRFDAARDIYRLLSGLLLFYAIYRYARLYTTRLGSILAMLLVSAVYPISFEWYIGQLTDPLSHLSFILAFIFLETETFPLLLTTLLIGSLAKETILAIFGFYVLFCRRQTNYVLRAIVLCSASLAIYFGVRLFVLHGAIHYQDISGVTFDHVLENWRDSKWHDLFLLTGGAYLPFLFLGWKNTPVLLKQLVFYLIPVLFVSSLFFSWLSETRNFMPLVFVLSVIGGRYLVHHAVDRDEPIAATSEAS
jgi:hypothetical protein